MNGLIEELPIITGTVSRSPLLSTVPCFIPMDNSGSVTSFTGPSTLSGYSLPILRMWHSRLNNTRLCTQCRDWELVYLLPVPVYVITGCVSVIWSKPCYQRAQRRLSFRQEGLLQAIQGKFISFVSKAALRFREYHGRPPRRTCRFLTATRQQPLLSRPLCKELIPMPT